MATVRAQARRRGAQVNEGVFNVLGTLAGLQDQIRSLLRGEPESTFNEFRLPDLLVETDRLVDRWQNRAIGATDKLLEEAWDLAPNMVDKALAAVEVPIGGTLIPESLLEELKKETTRGLKDLGPVAKKRIRDTIRTGVLGGETPNDVMQRIGSGVRRPGPFKFVAFRAEVITRTEMGRVHSMAGHSRLQHAARVVPGLKKQWFWSGKSRATHAEINEQIREVSEPFMVAGEELMYPRDPHGSPENTIMCGCESVPFKDGWQ